MASSYAPSQMAFRQSKRGNVIKLPRGASEGLLFDSDSLTSPISPSHPNLTFPPSRSRSPSFPSPHPTSSNTSPAQTVMAYSNHSIQISCQTAVSKSRDPDAFSPIEHARRAPPPDDTPSMKVFSSPSAHTLRVQLPATIRHEMVTISANKGDKIKVIADAWHMESDCHYEWVINFPPNDIDMSGIHAKFDTDGHLSIEVRRRPRYHA